MGLELTLWTARISLLLYAATIAVALRAPRDDVKKDRLLRCLWTAGFACFLAHVVSAFHFVHHWSHDAAYRETARRTAEMVGWEWGGGLYINHLFLALWAADVLWWWLAPQSHGNRSQGINALLHGFLAFIAFNGAVVFAETPTRWVGLAVTGALLWLMVLRIHRRRLRNTFNRRGPI